MNHESHNSLLSKVKNHLVTPLPRAGPLADREGDEELAALDAAAAAAATEEPLWPEDVAVGPRGAHEQCLSEFLFAMM